MKIAYKDNRSQEYTFSNTSKVIEKQKKNVRKCGHTLCERSSVLS